MAPVGVIDLGVQHEAIELGLGQRVGPFLLDRILGRHDEEQLRQYIAGPADADLSLGHGFQQCGLHLGRGTIDLIRQDQVVEQGAALEAEAAFFRPIDVRAGQVRRQQVGRELHALEVSLQRMRQRLDGARLGQARRTLDQQMAVRRAGRSSSRSTSLSWPTIWLVR